MKFSTISRLELRGMTLSQLRHALAEKPRLVAILTTSCHAKICAKSLGISCRNRDIGSDSRTGHWNVEHFIRGSQGTRSPALKLRTHIEVTRSGPETARIAYEMCGIVSRGPNRRSFCGGLRSRRASEATGRRGGGEFLLTGEPITSKRPTKLSLCSLQGKTFLVR